MGVEIKRNSNLQPEQRFTSLSNTDLNQKARHNNGGLSVEFSANRRMSGHPETNHFEVQRRNLLFTINIVRLQSSMEQFAAAHSDDLAV